MPLPGKPVGEPEPASMPSTASHAHISREEHGYCNTLHDEGLDHPFRKLLLMRDMCSCFGKSYNLIAGEG